MTASHISTENTRRPRAYGKWLKLSAALTDAVADIADRDDLTVTIVPGAGRGAPGCFVFAVADIELNGEFLKVDAATCDPMRTGDRNRYPALWGVLTHEAAHAHHSRWTHGAAGATGAHVEAAILLEESRIEAGQLRRRPADRRWLRSCATEIVMHGFTANGDQTLTDWQAAHAAALMLARRDAGVFDAHEVADVEALVTKTLGAGRLADLQAIWQAAHVTADTDAATMLDLGRRWCDVVGVDPDKPSDPNAAGQGGQQQSGNGQQGGNPGGSGQQEPPAPTPLEEAVASAVKKVESKERRDHAAERAEAEKVAKAIQEAEKARQAAEDVFKGDGTAAPGGTSGYTRFSGTRTATAAEQGAARRLAKLLRGAAHRERAVTVTTSATPPGRLRMRGALAADAQRAAGQKPTAEPFLNVQRRHVPNPPLRVGIACDVSGSMGPLAEPVASAAYILSRAASHVPDATAASVIFGRYVRAVTRPGQAPKDVATWPAGDGSHEIGGAVQALDQVLGLAQPGAARLLVIVSDGKFAPREINGGQAQIDRLVKSGCAVLWLALGDAKPMKGAHLVSLTDPAQAAGIIGQAAVKALRSA
ncbi:vWA domain-containing protein [Actinomadura opuntiae]|uniref:vWA domain-containing protein n=1 Tax=Actinomadura sp. OS1-43 TaxID=604315 RepID=UPI00255ABE89|nr:vWA domain-containing protein [Actinomadura sp. OS1-43]MDL4812756.1 VWA domain-containing protein [Actinomadura sp. OS1-43]